DDQQGEQLVPAADVPVDRRGDHPQAACDLAHAQPGDPLLDQLRVAELDDAGHGAFARERTGTGGTRSGGHEDILPHSESSALDSGTRAVFTEPVTQRAVLTIR